MSFSNEIIKKLNILNRNYKIGVLNYLFNTNNDINDLDFICILNNFLNQDLLYKLRNLEVFSYGLVFKKKFKDVYYIVND